MISCYFIRFYTEFKLDISIKSQFMVCSASLTLINFIKIKRYVLLCNKKKLIKRSFSSKLLFFCLLYLRLYRMHSRISTWNSYKIIKKIFYPSYVYTSTRAFYINMKNLLKFIFSLLTNFTNFMVTYIVISNESINALFLSRFIAKKLKQHSRVRSVLNPLKKEITRVIMHLLTVNWIIIDCLKKIILI